LVKTQNSNSSLKYETAETTLYTTSDDFERSMQCTELFSFPVYCGHADSLALLSVYNNQGWNKLWGRGAPAPQISMQWGKTRSLPPLSDGITVGLYGAAEIR